MTNYIQFCSYTLLLILFASACSGDYRKKAIGPVDEVIVVMDSSQWESETADAIRETFGRYIQTVPQPWEPAYTLIFRDFESNQELDELKRFRNIIIAAPLNEQTNTSQLVGGMLGSEVRQRVELGESFAFPLQDRWAREQWTLVLTSTSDERLAEKIRNSSDELLSHLEEREINYRTGEIYRRGEQVALADSLWENHGWSVRMQHDYVQLFDSTQSVMFRRYLPDNNRWMWAWWKDNVEHGDFINPEWINSTRDSLMQFLVQGERDSSYVETDYREAVKTQEFSTGSRLTGYETMGIWRMTNDFMGGPFVHFTYYDPETRRVFMIEYAQFAPRVNKRRFVRQFQAMGRTFASDSTWGKFNPDFAATQ
ncbi:DUF4837 family protein [Rhodohalobacter sp. SW132]|uniref:DUF4837 family protein n=1 Tax=Rhodohalobacter sp. SW132 TaxID=2293433 RepID=UPI000E24CD1F|nr:DUF4837 family protein [Rhodohalobacter sp. SW132]REL33356.1 DUF4837 family protein [Rhodohalobacter sp. SW132]